MTMTCIGRIPTSLIKETVEPEIDRRWALYDTTDDDTHLLAIDNLIKELIYYNISIQFAYKISAYLDALDVIKKHKPIATDVCIFTRDITQTYKESLWMTTDGTFYLEYDSDVGLVDDSDIPRRTDEDDFGYRLRVANVWAKGVSVVRSAISSDLDSLHRRLENYKSMDGKMFGTYEIEQRIRLLEAVIKSLEKED